ncbi:ATP-dependent zinc metalloprotease FtsH [Botrimarina hoheduenensis]|uniref:ATP-dependent zinc metalloprotease FtsH n=1 Tax=Botrimarina hoheduenensis TaxID=2528000 RepID=A0A5C5WA90_9BACT|nr:ATP-dependent zinc metalloprotease FtsH [Botrimarina hoheduenensis]TWT47580.1 ATP-dependent zinc metalloprotease FtsH [Botrimarina hoheduenensis]
MVDKPRHSSSKPPASREGEEGRGWRPPASTLLIIAIGVGLGMLLIQQLMDAAREVTYSTFAEAVEKENVRRVVVRGPLLYGEFIDPPLAPRLDPLPGEAASTAPREVLPQQFIVQLGDTGLRESLESKLLASGAMVLNEAPFDYNALLTVLWLGLLVAMGVMMWNFARRARDQVVGGGMLGGVTKSPARQYKLDDENRKTFDDVAGLRGVKSDLKEIVDFLKEPEKFARLGARVPKGVLLNGPPGTGKTLLAKAVAGEAGVPFFSINGSEFIQLFVGVGASRVRDMFATAKKQAPAILFIDEIDAVGRQRGAGLGGGHDEREQTLNQILSEMDGFDPSETVIVMAATNRPDVLDPALLRPGRFDRHVTVDRPTIEGREQLFEVHSRKVPISESVDFAKLARATVGMTGADIMNLVNEAALWATRNDRSFVTPEDFEYARDKVLMGDAREDVLSEKEKQVTAYHEAGHALLGWFVPSGNLVHKVTIIPRGRALGVTQYVPEEDRHNISLSELQAQLAMALAGRAAEQLAFNELSAGAENDLKRATDLARRMVAHWGMSERIGPVAYNSGHNDPFLGREIVQEHRAYSEHTAQMIDEEISRTLHEAERLADEVLLQQRDKLEAVANALLEKEELDDTELVEILGPPVSLENSPLAPTKPTYVVPGKSPI